jgi:DNA-binding XRE family transcriptional regulator
VAEEESVPVAEASVKERIEQFRDFHMRLELQDLENNQIFQAVMQETQVLLEMSDSEIANALSISRPTLNRWINGRTSPHLAVKKAAVAWIGEQVAIRVRLLQSTRSTFGPGSSTPAYGGRFAAKSL